MKNLADLDEPVVLQNDTLLKKFDIPLHHLDFSYVETCNDGRELEKILQILKSGEEGYYPDLTATTEERLTLVKPNSKYIRKMTPVLPKSEIDKGELQELSHEFDNWLTDMKKNDEELEFTKSKSLTRKDIPDVRKTRVTKPGGDAQKSTKRIQSTDYASWDKYDPDTEILKMDLEDEKLKKSAENDKHKPPPPQKERAVKFSEFRTQAEAIFEANREKEKGNEYFKAGEYENALHHYTTSIACCPSSILYTNRAITYIKLRKYQKAIEDCQEALRYDANNLKGHLRMAQGFEGLQRFPEALYHAEKVIKKDPNNVIAQQIAEKARKSTDQGGSGNVRFKIVEIDSEPKEMSSADVKDPQTNTGSKKSILKKRKTNEDYEIIPIPGTSKMSSPYYKTVHSKDPRVIRKEKQMINNKPQPLYLTTIDAISDDDNDCTENHLQSRATNKRRKDDSDKENQFQTKIIQCESKVKDTFNATSKDDQNHLILDQNSLQIIQNTQEFSKTDLRDCAQAGPNKINEDALNNNTINMSRNDLGHTNRQIIVEEENTEMIHNAKQMTDSQTDRQNQTTPEKEKDDASKNIQSITNSSKYYESKHVKTTNEGPSNTNDTVESISKRSEDTCATINKETKNHSETTKTDNGNTNKDVPQRSESEDQRVKMLRKSKVITMEVLRTNPTKPKVTNIAEKYKQPCVMNVKENATKVKATEVKTGETSSKRVDGSHDDIKWPSTSKLVENETAENRNSDINVVREDPGSRASVRNRPERYPGYGNSEITESQNDDKRGGGEPHIEKQTQEAIPAEIHLPYTFLRTWQSVKRDGTYSGLANVLKTLNMDRIAEVFGNKMDATVMSDIINCLYRHFTVVNEVDKVYSALVNLCRVDRFAIVVMFLSQNDKQLVQNLVDFLKQHGRVLPDGVLIQYGLKL